MQLDIISLRFCQTTHSLVIVPFQRMTIDNPESFFIILKWGKITSPKKEKEKKKDVSGDPAT
jgi:hypothetical protein